MDKVMRSRYAKPFLASAVVAIVGLAAWAYMLTADLANTVNMSNMFSWGFLIAIFAFLVGFGAGGQLVAAYIVLKGDPVLKRYALPAQAIALAGSVGAAVAVLADLGSPLNILAMILAPNPASPLTWDMVALTAFIAVAVVCLVAIAREWKSLKVWMCVGIVTAVALQIVEGLLFSLQTARAWWASAIMPVDFLAVACVCGAAIMVGVAAFDRSDDASAAMRAFSRLFLVTVIVHVLLMAAEIVVLMGEGTAASQATLARVQAYAPLYACEILLPLAAAVWCMVRSQKMSGKERFAASAVAVAGLLCHRLMLLYPAMGGSSLHVGLSNASSSEWAFPVSTGMTTSANAAFQLSQAYVPSLVEVLSALLPIGLAFAIVALAMMVAQLIRRRS